MQTSIERSISVRPKLTSTPPPESRAPRPEFFRLPKTGRNEIDPHFGFSRSFYYALEKRGKLKLHRIVAAGKEKGIVVIRYLDVLSFIEAQITQEEAKAR